jgi:hypothetical protein
MYKRRLSPIVRAGAIVLGCGIAGALAVASSRAATVAVSAELESGVISGAAAVASAASASGGKSVAFGAAAVCAVSQATGATATSAFPATGATANDSTDDYPAIQAAINRAGDAGGGVVSLPAGTFMTNGHLALRTNVKLTGTGPQTIIKAGSQFLNSEGPNFGYPLITTNNASNVTISNLTADQSGDSYRFTGSDDLRLTAYLIDIHHSTNTLVEGVSTRNPFTYSIVAYAQSTKFCIRNNNTRVATSGLYDQLDGIHVLDSSFGDVLNNQIDQRVGTDGDDGLVAHTIGGPMHDVAYIGNKVRGGNGGDGMQLAVGAYPIYNLTIANNEIYDSPFGIRTGYYAPGTGAVHDISLTGNYIHDLRPGVAFPDGGDAINIGGYPNPAGQPGPVTNIKITNNRACNAGKILVVQGSGNVISGSTGC